MQYFPLHLLLLLQLHLLHLHIYLHLHLRLHFNTTNLEKRIHKNKVEVLKEKLVHFSKIYSLLGMNSKWVMASKRAIAGFMSACSFATLNSHYTGFS